MDSAIISDRLRSTIAATRQDDGRIVVRAANRFLIFTVDEIDRLARFARGEGVLQRYPRRFTAEHSATSLSAPESDELTAS